MRVGRHEVKISNPEKLFFPERGLTKADLVQYYVDLAQCALNQIRRRPFHMKRYPNGVEGDYFHQKRVPAHPDYVGEQFVRFPSGHSTIFAVIDNAAALAWVINLGCIELSRLDPAKGATFQANMRRFDASLTPWTNRIASWRRRFKGAPVAVTEPVFGYEAQAIGLHILTPVRPELPFPEVRRFAKAVAQEVERRVGDQRVATTTWKVADRKGVFVDYGQNARDRTIASAYSIRPTPDARASAPLRWDEVPGVDPAAFTLETMRRRLEKVGDLTAGMWRRRVSLASRFAALDLEPADPDRFDDRSWHTALEPWV